MLLASAMVLGVLMADPPSGEGAMAPRLTSTRDGLVLSWLEPDADGHRLAWCRWTDGTWADARTVVVRDAMFANWADVPAVVEGGDGALYAHWLRRSGDAPYAYDIAVLRSADGETWRELGTLNDDGIAAEHGFVSYVPVDDGVRAYWLDGRETGGGHGGRGMMTLRTAIVGERVEPSTLVDSSVCDCCNTGAAMTGAGPIVVYRDRTDAEVRDTWAAGGARADASSVHDDGWVIPACPVNGPSVAADGRRVAVAWFTAVDGGTVRVAFSDDAGATFGEAITVDRSNAGGSAHGRVDVVLDRDDAIVCWVARRDGRDALLALRVSPTGVAGESVIISPVSAARSGGFPQMEAVDGTLAFVWRDVDTDRLRSKTMPAASIGD